MRNVAPPFRLSLLELERRDVPAWWAVTLPESPAGTLGDTAAAHSGELTWAAGYAPDQDGRVRVYADTAEDAVAAAVTGSVTVTHSSGLEYAHAFGPDTVGTSAGERRPFLVEADGGVVTVAFEDMAGLSDSDWDYNDRSWGGVSVAAASNGGTQTLVSVIGEGMPGLMATLTTTVTMGTDAYPDLYLWHYRLRNDDFGDYFGQLQGIASLTVHHTEVNAVQMVGNTRGWENHPGGINDPWAGGDDLATWWMEPLDTVIGMMPGEISDFWFYTAARPIIMGGVSVYSHGVAVGSLGAALVPAALVPTATTQVVSVTWPDASRLPTGMTMTATVTGNPQAAAPTGAVKFMSGSTVLGTAQLTPGANGVSTAVFAGAAPTVGTQQITAEYQGDGKYLASKSPAAQVDLEVAVTNGAAFAANTQPTGGNLTWANYNGAVPAGLTGPAAYTALDSEWRADQEVITLTVFYGGVANSQARATVTGMDFRMIFSRARSWANAAAQLSPALLVHKNLHLTMSEWISTRAAANRPPMVGKGGGQNIGVPLAKAAANGVALNVLAGLRAAYVQKWLDIIEAAALAYDSGTSLPGQGGGSAAANQALWEANWQTYLQPLLNNNGWN